MQRLEDKDKLDKTLETEKPSEDDINDIDKRAEYQRRETINALIETNETWLQKLDETTNKYVECLEKSMDEFLLQKTQPEKKVMREICQENKEVEETELKNIELLRAIQVRREQKATL